MFNSTVRKTWLNQLRHVFYHLTDEPMLPICNFKLNVLNDGTGLVKLYVFHFVSRVLCSMCCCIFNLYAHFNYFCFILIDSLLQEHQV